MTKKRLTRIDSDLTYSRSLARRKFIKMSMDEKLKELRDGGIKTIIIDQFLVFCGMHSPDNSFKNSAGIMFYQMGIKKYELKIEGEKRRLWWIAEGEPDSNVELRSEICRTVAWLAPATKLPPSDATLEIPYKTTA